MTKLVVFRATVHIKAQKTNQEFCWVFFFGQCPIDWFEPPFPWINAIFYVTVWFDSTGSGSILLCLLTAAEYQPSPLAFGSVSLIVSLFPLFICVSLLCQLLLPGPHGSPCALGLLTALLLSPSFALSSCISHFSPVSW